VGSAHCINLEQLDWLGQAAKAPVAESLQREAVGIFVGEAGSNGGGHEDLAAVSCEADACRGMHGEPDVAGFRECRTATVQADSEPHVVAGTWP
jgi:hypothetical protein